MNTERKLVTIRKVDKVVPIYTKKEHELARCELVCFDGWKAMVSREDGFKPGDLAIFAETDSIFPKDDERFAFLQKCNYRIKTQKYNSLVDENGEPIRSQGLCLPTSFLPKDVDVICEGMDVTEMLGVTMANDEVDEFAANAEFSTKTTKKPKFIPNFIHHKMMHYEWYRNTVNPPVQKGFPSEVSKTDEERIQNLGKIFDVDTTWTLTEKVDGMSSTYLLRKKRTSTIRRIFKGQDYEFVVCSRNNKIGPNDSAQWAMARKYNIEKALREMIERSQVLFGYECDWICIQGECVGPKIQKNRLQLPENELMAFNLITPRERIKSVKAAKILGAWDIKWVPIITSGFSIKNLNCDDLLNLADSQPSMVNSNCLREGIVFRAEREDMDLSFKAVSPKYLMKIGE